MLCLKTYFFNLILITFYQSDYWRGEGLFVPVKIFFGGFPDLAAQRQYGNH